MINFHYALRCNTGIIISPHAFLQASRKEHDVLEHFIPEIQVSYGEDSDESPQTHGVTQLNLTPQPIRDNPDSDWLAELMSATVNVKKTRCYDTTAEPTCSR